MKDALTNYFSLVAKVDELCSRIEGEFADQIACRSGCSGCCRHITLSWVEAVALATSLAALPSAEVEEIRHRARTASLDGACPLLTDDRCALYRSRPIICRTHGLPILTQQDGTGRVDFCPLNFTGVDRLPGSALLDLDRLNTLLDSINRLFIAEAFDECPTRERLAIAEALLLDLDPTGDIP